ncbi:MAG: hypothetical protein ACKVQS_10620 [Fimbriimonadaceae bacterium]
MKLQKSLLIVLGASALALVGCFPSMAPHSVAVVQPPTKAEILEKLGKNVSFSKQRVERDPQGAIGLAMLSESYLAVARVSDDDDAAKNAEAAARASLRVRTVNNARAARRLTEALLAQHKFKDAKESAALAVQVSGEDPQCLRQYGEVLLELGEYSEFKTLLSKHQEMTQSPEGLAMLSRWFEVIGKPEMSTSLLEKAVDKVKASGSGHESVLSWYKTQLGWTLLRSGHSESAKAEFDNALKVNPLERKALAGLAKIAYDTNDWQSVVELSKRANDIAPLTDVMGWEAIALQKLGKDSEAEALILEIQKVNKLTPEEAAGVVHAHGAADLNPNSRHTHSRLYSKFLADSGRHLEFAHHAAEEDMEWRHDIHAYDTFAWTTYRFWLLDPKAKLEGDGLLKEAQVAIKKAMSLGTKDVEIVAHAKEILAAQPRGK